MIQLIETRNSFYDLLNNAWSGAKDTLEIIMENEKEDEFMSYCESIFYEPIDATEFNDWLWFDRDTILEDLGVVYE